MILMGAAYLGTIPYPCFLLFLMVDYWFMIKGDHNSFLSQSKCAERTCYDLHGDCKQPLCKVSKLKHNVCRRGIHGAPCYTIMPLVP